MNLLQNLLSQLVVSLFLATSALLLPDCQAQDTVPAPPAPPRQVMLRFVGQQPASPDEAAQDRTEYTRTILRSFIVDPKAALAIDNRFGDVTVSLWKKNEFRVQIAILASSESPDWATKALNAVTVDEDRQDHVFSFKTVISDDFSRGWKRFERRNVLRVHYRISMPEANALTIHNKFGNVTLPDFSAPLRLDTQFGNVYGSALSNAATTINAQFGNVSLRDVQHGNVSMSFGDLDINSGNVLTIKQNYGKLRIGETNRVEARMNYADAVIGAIRQSGKLDMSYARQFQLNQLAASADELEVNAKFSTIALPVLPQSNCDFDVTVTHGGFTYPTLPNLRLTLPTPPTPPRPGMRRQYTGRVGTGDGPRIRVVAVFGDVKFK
jgi:hypothetical protein